MVDRTMAWYPAGPDPLTGDPIELQVSGRGFKVLRGVTGFDSPSYSMVFDVAAGVDGFTFDPASVVAQRDTIEVPVLLQATSRQDMRTKRQDLLRATDPKRGAGVLVLGEAVGTIDGTMRYARAVYRSGLEGDTGQEVASTGFWQFTLRFTCLDAYWSSLDPALGSWVGRDSVPFFPRSFPWRFSEYGVEPLEVLDVTGDSPSYPSFSLTGPFTRLRFTLDRTGEWWEVARGTDDRNVDLLVDTRPRVKILDAAGVSQYRWRADGSTFFPLAPGDTVTVTAAGTTEATRVDISVPEAWLSAW